LDIFNQFITLVKSTKKEQPKRDKKQRALQKLIKHREAHLALEK